MKLQKIVRHTGMVLLCIGLTLGSTGCPKNKYKDATPTPTPDPVADVEYTGDQFVTPTPTPTTTATPTPTPAGAAPVIVEDPAGVLTVSGETVTLMVIATGSNLSYQWYDVTGTEPAAVGTNAAFFTTGVLTTNRSYQVVVSNDFGYDVSLPGNITVIAAPTPTPTPTPTVAPIITQQPASTTVANGTSITLSVVASGNNLNYQWYDSTQAPAVAVGTNAATYTTGALLASRSYFVAVSNGSGAVVSDAVTVTVLPEPPVITQAPVEQAVSSGERATFSVTATGQSLSYQWYMGTPGDTSSPVDGAIGVTFQTAPITQTTPFWVRVSNPGGAVDSSVAMAYLSAPPYFGLHPGSVNVLNGEHATLTANIYSHTPSQWLSIQWYMGTSGDTSNPVVGGISPSLYIGPMLATTPYWVRATNEVGSTDSMTGYVIVDNSTDSGPVITTEPSEAYVLPGGSATFTVQASGNNLVYQWFGGPANLASAPINGATGATYTTGALTESSIYWVRVYNSGGVADSTSAVGIVVSAAPTITAQPESIAVALGAPFQLAVEVGQGAPATFQWYQGLSGDESNPVSGATDAILSIPSATTTVSYWVKLTNLAGSTNSNTATITLK